MDIKFIKPSLPKAGALVITLTDSLQLSDTAKELDKKTGGAIKRAIKIRDFKGKSAEIIDIIAPTGVDAEVIVLAGAGDVKKLGATQAQKLGGSILAYLNAIRAKKATVVVDGLEKGKLALEEVAANLGYGALLRSYRFDKYRTREKEEKKPTLTTLTLAVAKSTVAEKHFATLESVAGGVFLTRDLVSEPPNVLNPETYAARIKEELTKAGVEVEILGVEKMKRLNMGALLGVGQGSEVESQLVVMRWHGDPKGKKSQPVAFIGKGVTFDTGGISLKPGAGMEDMKYDMAGSGVVVGLMKALASRKAKVNAVGVVGLVENMPDGNAQRPSDVVHTMSGQTVEVLNTDAEGRLVLADALWYCQDRFKPQFMVNLATLTGAIVVALADQFAGLFSNNDDLSKKLAAAGEVVEEKLWRFPLTEEYDAMINSKIADMQNISDGRGAGSITAAQFLQRFVNGTPWAHLDIAGVAWKKKDTPLAPEGATAFGVRLLNQFVVDNYEG